MYYFWQTSKYETKVEKDSVKFEVAVNILHNTENLYIVKFTRVMGDPTKFNEICNSLLNFVMREPPGGLAVIRWEREWKGLTQVIDKNNCPI